MCRTGRIVAFGLLAAWPALSTAAPGRVVVKASNRLRIARPNQTIELTASQLAPVGEKDLGRIHVRDAAGKEVLCQAVDIDGDYTPDRVIFQSDFAPGETRTFTVESGAKVVYTREQFRAYGRFVRERFDDFAWENDRIAHRMYGKALETWVREPLTSSTVDIWSKRVPRLVINEWYMVDNYHVDTGEGADFYSAGRSRGDGGNGLWAADQLWVSKNFVNTRVLANGPIRILFELFYEPFDVNGKQVAEVKRISLDAGQNLDHFTSLYKLEGGGPLVTGVGLKKVAGERVEFDEKAGMLAKWEAMEKRAGFQGLAVLVDPAMLEKRTEDKLNHLVLAGVGADNSASYWAGFCWDKAGQFTNFEAWVTFLKEFSRRLASPIEIQVVPE